MNSNNHTQNAMWLSSDRQPKRNILNLNIQDAEIIEDNNEQNTISLDEYSNFAMGWNNDETSWDNRLRK